MKKLRDKLVADLTESKVIVDQVSRALLDSLELQSNQVRDYLESPDKLLEEVQADMIFSPMYTPSWEDRARYVEDRERVEISSTLIGVIIKDLVAEGVLATYLYEDETICMPIPEVLIDRWVRRLHLDIHIDKRILQAIEATIPNGSRASVKALSGDPAWLKPGCDEILIAFLTSYARTGRFSVSKFEELTGLMHTHRPRDLGHFHEQINGLMKSYQEDSGEHFFDSHLKEAHGPLGVADPVSNSQGDSRRLQIYLAAQIQEDLKELKSASQP